MTQTDTSTIAIATPVVGSEELELLRDVLDSGWLTQGPKVAEFERRFARRHGVSHAIAVTSCTTGLHLALLSLGIGPGDEVIVPSFTWIASANAVLYCGAIPILCDVDPATFNIDIDDALRKVTGRTRAVVAVHLFGLCADVAALRACLPDRVEIVEDAACAAGAARGGRAAGSLGRVGVFSFHPRKTITTGEGGMITTDDDDLAAVIRQLRNHGSTQSEEERHHGPRPHLLPEFPVLGYNYRMTDLQGAVGLAQLARLDTMLAARSQWAAWYGEHLSAMNWLTLPGVPGDCRHGWQAYVTLVDESRSPAPAAVIMDRLAEQGIMTRPGTHAIHRLGYYRQRFGYTDNQFPGASACATRSLAIPLHNRMTAQDFMRVTEALAAL
ncbi:DegT/DnrJ/EryC1/StrS family aminotransferase [Magnetospirillum moscoviense]|uniref:Perosamine synthetase n=1 Tax=Magnetospirillum moscoviense TaxID=1437059 RepID=A0A178MZ09_9PROT|nr:DegT/DnrJ/EryC1/StrS family aminotransferase [Magnetospirillum moscoviense]OAN55094.1 perosamine synthetase [Magnetospirillum moscoviense]